MLLSRGTLIISAWSCQDRNGTVQIVLKDARMRDKGALGAEFVSLMWWPFPDGDAAVLTDQMCFETLIASSV